MKILLIVITLCAGALAQSQAVIQSSKAGHDLDPDTNPASGFWKSAPAVFATNDNFGKPWTGLKTEIRSRWTKDNLYFLFICPYDELWLKPEPATGTETNKLWDWDVAEVFIGSDFEHIRRYKEFELSPQGEWVDLDINLDSRASAGGVTGTPISPLQPASIEMPKSGMELCAFRGQRLDARQPAPRKQVPDQFLPPAGASARSQTDLLAAHAEGHLSRPGELSAY